MSLKERLLGYIFSILFHCLLIAIFLLIGVNLQPVVPEFVELFLSSDFVIQSSDQEEGTSKPSAPRASRGEKQLLQAREIVDLPVRKTLDLDEPNVPVAQKDKIVVTEEPVIVGQRLSLAGEPEREEIETNRIFYGEKREAVESPEIKIGDKLERDAPVNDVGSGIVRAQSYKIEWTGGAREKIRGELPPFPEEVTKDAIIRVRFKVRPDGTVAEAIPLQKGSTILENVSLTILKQWQFNPLESAAPQILQEGTITFIFRLE